MRDRFRGRRSIVSDIAVCGRRDVSLPRNIQSQRAAKQRSELSPRRGFASLGLTFRINLFGAAERRPIGQSFSTPQGSRSLALGLALAAASQLRTIVWSRRAATQVFEASICLTNLIALPSPIT